MSLDIARDDERARLHWSRELLRCEDSFDYLASHYLRIKSKHVIGFPPLVFNPVQQLLRGKMDDQWRRTGWVRQIWGKVRQIGACLDPETRVLMADLRWKRLADVEIGDLVVSVDEYSPPRRGAARKMLAATVVERCEVDEPAYRLSMDNGETLIATGRHRFLSRKTLTSSGNTWWRPVKLLRPGTSIRSIARPWLDGDYEDGWFGGLIDGEGFGRVRPEGGVEVTITQVAGLVLDRAERYLKERGYTIRQSIDVREPGVASKLGSQPVHKLHLCRMNELFRLLGQTRPSRVLPGHWWENKALPGYGRGGDIAWAEIVKVESLGYRRMIDLQTTTKTFIAEGFVSHNSTLGRAVSFHQTAFKDNRNAFLAAHDEEAVYELFETTDKSFLTALPAQLQPTVSANSKTRLAYPTRNSKVLVGHSKNLNVGASQMNHIWHLTEVARYGTNADSMQAALFPSFSDAKGDDHSIGIIESTSVYGGHWFKEFAEAAMAGDNGYEFTFIPWFIHADYTAPVPRFFHLTADEKELKRKYTLTDGNLVWRRMKKSEYVSNPALFHQDFASSWEESWQLPKGTLRVFDDELLGMLDQQLRPGRRFNAEPTGLKESLGGLIEVWALPEEGVYYKLGADPAEGRTYDADWTVLEVIRLDTLEQVAEARFHMDPASEEFTNLVYWLGMAYNAAEINPDITGGWGMALMSDLQKRSYPNIWNWRRRDDARERVSTRLGFLYTKRDKIILVNTAVGLTRRGGIIVHSEGLVEELRNFLNIGLDEWGAAPGYKDDRCSAWFLALLAARDERIDMPDASDEDKALTAAVSSYRRHDVDHDLQDDPDEPSALSVRPWGVR